MINKTEGYVLYTSLSFTIKLCYRNELGSKWFSKEKKSVFKNKEKKRMKNEIRSPDGRSTESFKSLHL